jgi:hypothetical protein
LRDLAILWERVGAVAKPEDYAPIVLAPSRGDILEFTDRYFVDFVVPRTRIVLI